MKRRELGAITAAAVLARDEKHARDARDARDARAPARSSERLDGGWRFIRQDVAGAEAARFDDSSWEPATLPHTARIESLVTGPPGTPGAQWQGICWYRRRLFFDSLDERPAVSLHFEGAMNVADVWLDGEHIARHLGGYLPFSVDLSGRARGDAEHALAVRLDNQDNPITGPKPLAQLDFNLYHGLYRPVHLVQAGPLHVTDPLLANRPAGGGIFVTYPAVSRESATVRVKTHVRNAGGTARELRVRAALRTPRGRMAALETSPPVSLAPGAEADVITDLEVRSPALWSPASPALHTLDVDVLAGGEVVDSRQLRAGIRRIAIDGDRIVINGERLFLRGANRHQEHPWIGNALSDAAQYRDARRIREAGFDYIRLSHYPHSESFMDACDELGLVVMDCIPGWQYFNPDPEFVELQYRNCRDMIRRDRNHPCVIMWEVSLNESAMPAEFVARTHAIAHEEYPGDQCFTAGWVPGYDVFIDARQHGGCRSGRHRPCVVSEYGDWEYYAMNAGLDQDAWRDLAPAESNSRQLRWQGERALLQQATNFQEAHNDNLATGAFADGLWVMFDYNRGYSPDVETSGCMDLFRIPKFSYWFFRSQRSGEPVVFIASHWTPRSSPRVRVFSNCDEVALYLNERLIERRRPDRDRISSRLAHPPFTFDTGGFSAGLLEAVGYRDGRRAADHAVRTPGEISRLALSLDLSGRAIQRDRFDQVFCHARLEDAHGTLAVEAWENVAFAATGGVTIIGNNPASSEAGIATVLLRTEPGRPGAVYAAARAAGGRAIYASLSLGGGRAGDPARAVAPPDPGTPRYRIPVSAPPERREPFRR